jgi:UrcA family protein
MKRNVAAALVAVITSFAGSSAFAMPETAPSVKVQLADLDLAGQAGAEVAMRRISNAAQTVCGGAPDLRNMSRYAIYNRCRREAIERAVGQLDRPQVTALLSKPTTREFASR